MSYPAYAAPAQPAPLSELNTTPLIDVLLVLLVMFIITIPVATHTLAIDLPQGTPPAAVLSPVENKVVVARDGTTYWNGEQVSREELSVLLARAAAMSPEPVTLFEPDANSSFADTADVVRRVKDARVTRFAFVDNQRYRSFAAD